MPKKEEFKINEIVVSYYRSSIFLINYIISLFHNLNKRYERVVAISKVGNLLITISADCKQHRVYDLNNYKENTKNNRFIRKMSYNELRNIFN